MSHVMRRWAPLVVFAAGLLAGCGERDAGVRGSVRGRVTLDGSPLAAGWVTFEPTAGTSGPTAGGEIAKGVLSIKTAKGPAIGTNLVRISSKQPTGRTVPNGFGGTMDELAEAVPKHYNTATTLEVEIKKGRNDLSFDLKSK